MSLQGDNVHDDMILSRMSAVNSFALHAFAAVVVSPIATVVALFAAVLTFHNSSGINSVLNAWGVANPYMWGLGLVLGMLLNRIALRRTACYVWLVGVAWMAFGIVVSLYSYSVRWLGICSPFDTIMRGFFSVGSNIYCGDQANIMSFTLPTFSSIGYSLGAWAAMLYGSRAEQSDAAR